MFALKVGTQTTQCYSVPCRLTVYCFKLCSFLLLRSYTNSGDCWFKKTGILYQQEYGYFGMYKIYVYYGNYVRVSCYCKCVNEQVCLCRAVIMLVGQSN